MSDQPKFYTKNYARILKNVVTVSSGDANKYRLTDGVRELRWSSFGSNDATQEYIIFDFVESREIGVIFLDNINLKNFKIQYWNGSAFADVTGAAETTYALTYWLKEFTPVTTQKIKIIMDTTQTTNAEKKVGEVYACATNYQLATTIGFDYSMQTTEIGSSYRLGSGIMEKNTTAAKYNGTFELYDVDASTEATLYAIYSAFGPFCFMPEPEAAPAEFYEVFWANPWADRYAGVMKANGKQITIELTEV